MKLPNILIPLTLTTLISAAANAATYYVATTGSDSNPGTITQPFLTIGKGVATITAGDTLLVRGGTYNEAVTIWNKYGSETAPISISSYEGETAVIDGTGTSASNAVVAIGGNSSWISFDAFEVRNGPNSGIMLYNANHINVRWNNVHDNQKNGIYVTTASSSAWGTTHHVLVQENEVHHNVLRNNPIGTSWDQALSALRADYVDFIDNWVHENYGEGIDYILSDHGNIIDNEVWDNFSADIYLDNAQYTKVDRNWVISGWSSSATSFYRSGHPASGIAVANETYSVQNPATDLTITNNIVVRCKFGFTYGNYEYGGGLHNTLIANNTFVKSTDLLLYIQNGTTNVHDTTTVENNIFYPNSGQNYAYATSTLIVYATNCWYGGNSGTQKSGLNDVLANPLLADASGWDDVDFQLTSTSPCINAGTTATAVTADYWEHARSGVFDIGAHEY